MDAPSRFSYAVCTAGVLHLAAIVGLGLCRRGDDAPRGSSRDDGQPLVPVALWFSESETRAPSPDTREVTAEDVRPGTLEGAPTRAARRSSMSNVLPTTTARSSFATSSDETFAIEGPRNLAEQADTDGSDPTANPGPTHLTRDQLGLGVASYRHVLPEKSPVLEEQRARLELGRNLERSLRQDAEEHAGELGLGKEGPLLRGLEGLAQTSLVDLTGFATIHVRLHKGGRLEFDLLGTSSDRAAWLRVLERAKREFVALNLSPPPGSEGLDLVIRVDSRVQMPSGADPGFGVKVFGIPLKKGEGKRSAGVELFSSLPRLELDDSAATASQERGMQARLKMDLLKIPLDPADLSGKRSRIVSARVLKRTVL